MVLTRTEGQEILVGEGPDAIRIMLVTASHGRARIGVTAPSHLSIDRLEVREVKERGYNPPPAGGGAR